MALHKILRHRAPIDGSTFRTMGNLSGLLRVASKYDEDMHWPVVCNETRVPIFVRMVKYKAQETPVTPDGMIFGPVVKIGSTESPEIEMFGHHWSAGLTQDYHLDSLEKTNKWLYFPIEGDVFPPGEDASFYTCGTCNEALYRDDRGRRFDRSACLHDGGLVCRNCDVRGLVMDQEADDQLKRARSLAKFVGGDCLMKLDGHVSRLAAGFSFGNPCQTRLFREDRFSFNWSSIIFTKEGKKRGMNGGLIQHGPCPIEAGDGYKFRQWDYSLKAERDATKEEISNISWSIHT